MKETGEKQQEFRMQETDLMSLTNRKLVWDTNGQFNILQLLQRNIYHTYLSPLKNYHHCQL